MCLHYIHRLYITLNHFVTCLNSSVGDSLKTLWNDVYVFHSSTIVPRNKLSRSMQWLLQTAKCDTPVNITDYRCGGRQLEPVWRVGLHAWNNMDKPIYSYILVTLSDRLLQVLSSLSVQTWDTIPYSLVEMYILVCCGRNLPTFFRTVIKRFRSPQDGKIGYFETDFQKEIEQKMIV